MIFKIRGQFNPALTKWHVQRILKWIPATDMAGIEFVELADEDPEDPNASKTPPELRGFLYNGRYRKESASEGTHIELYTRDLYFGIPRVLRFTSVATLKIASTLAHEIGHHVIATQVQNRER
jgi:hypothetical protein